MNSNTFLGLLVETTINLTEKPPYLRSFLKAFFFSATCKMIFPTLDVQTGHLNCTGIGDLHVFKF